MDDNDKPRLVPGCRLLVPEQGDSVLLVPEGAFRLLGRARDVVELVDGQRTVGDIVTSLVHKYSGGEATIIRDNTINLLDRLERRGVMRR